MILAAVAVHAKGKLNWDSEKCEFSNNKSVNRYVKPTLRTGWELKL
jgi:hypothetical protein